MLFSTVCQGTIVIVLGFCNLQLQKAKVMRRNPADHIARAHQLSAEVLQVMVNARKAFSQQWRQVSSRVHRETQSRLHHQHPFHHKHLTRQILCD
jgi:hypothetical protein